jgi:hypothetical protein
VKSGRLSATNQRPAEAFAQLERMFAGATANTGSLGINDVGDLSTGLITNDEARMTKE